MGFEPVYNVIRADCKKRLGSAQTVVECRLAPEAPAKIKKVLSIACAESVTSCEARVAGRVVFKVLYLDKDGAAQVMENGADFSDKIADGGISAGMKAFPECAAVDIDTVAVSEDEIKLSSVLETRLFAGASERITHLKEGGEELFAQKETIAFCELASDGDDTFLVSDERASKEKLSRILMSEARVAVRNAYAGADCFVIEGTVITDVTAETEDKSVRSINLTTDFKQEIAGKGVMPEHGVLADAALKSLSARLEQDMESGSAIIKSEATLSVRASAYSAASAEVVTDAFCLLNELNMATESYKFGRYMFSKCLNEKIEGSAALETGMPYIDSVTALCGARMNIANAFAENDRIRIEGLVNVGVIYWNRESESHSSVQVELPFSVTASVPGVKEGCEIIAKGVICDISARPRKGTEVDITASVSVNAQVFEICEGLCVKEAEIGEPRSAKMSAIAVYVTKDGETLWDAAKALRTTPELIMSYNPGLKVPLSGGEKILVYRQRTASF